MHQPEWQPHQLALPDHQMAWYEAGTGPTVVWLSGGPGDDHAYLRPVAAPLIDRFRCILYDQRGTGHSRLDQLDETTLHVDRLLDDLDALRRHLGADRLRLVGHSWGANLALLYCSRFPACAKQAVLVGLGPLDDEFASIAAANLLKPLTAAERRQHADLSAQMRQALADDDQAATATIHARRFALTVRALFFSPEQAARFLTDYLAADAHRKLNRRVNHLVYRSYRQLPVWEHLDRVEASLLILYGYQDFEPITQAYHVQQHVPQAHLCFINECGHLPWHEQPETFYRELAAFLQPHADHAKMDG